MLRITFLFLILSLATSIANSYSGVVKDDLLDQPISYVQVTLLDENFNRIDSVYTNFQGAWSIEHDPTGVEPGENIPNSFTLNQNYPNPFNPSTVISFSIESAGEVKLLVSDVLGQTISVKSGFLNSGSHSIDWQGSGSAGVYFYTLVYNNKSVTRKMVQLDGYNGGGLSEFRPASNKSVSVLSKTNSDTYFLILSKFAYVNDTIKIEAEGNYHYETALRSIHSNALLFDLHNDVLERMLASPNFNYHLNEEHTYWHTDIPRLKKGGVDAELFVVWVSTSCEGRYFEVGQQMVQMFQDELFANANDLVQTFNASTTLEVVNAGKIAGVMVVEGGHTIENSIDNLKTLYDQGMRYLTITWNNSTDWAVSAADSRSATVGLSDFGREVIRTMDTLGVIIDVSHTGIKTIEDILEVTTNPIIASHSGVRALYNHSRNLYDYQIEAIANTGGVIGVVFYPPFLGSPSSSVDINTVVRHINYIVNLVGVDCAALGSDFDGIGDNTVNGLEDVSKFPYLTYRLLQEGYTREEVEKILGGNFMRVFKQVCGE